MADERAARSQPGLLRQMRGRAPLLMAGEQERRSQQPCIGDDDPAIRRVGYLNRSIPTVQAHFHREDGREADSGEGLGERWFDCWKQFNKGLCPLAAFDFL